MYEVQTKIPGFKGVVKTLVSRAKAVKMKEMDPANTTIVKLF